jgi:hypothetical protein
VLTVASKGPRFRCACFRCDLTSCTQDLNFSSAKVVVSDLTSQGRARAPDQTGGACDGTG